MQLWASIRARELSVDVFLPASESEPPEGVIRSVRHGRIRSSRAVALTQLPRSAPAPVDLDAIETVITQAIGGNRRSGSASSCGGRLLTPCHDLMSLLALDRARLQIWRFCAVADTWELSGVERSLLVRLSPETCVDKLLPWAINAALVSRMQFIVQLWLCLYQCVDDPSIARRWLRTRMDDAPFAGKCALDLMSTGRAKKVREYLDGMSTHQAEARIRQACRPPPVTGATTIDDIAVTAAVE